MVGSQLTSQHIHVNMLELKFFFGGKGGTWTFGGEYLVSTPPDNPWILAVQ